MTSGVFGLNKIYKKLVENVDNKNFASWPENNGYGYYGGGRNPGGTAFFSNINRLDFTNETTSVPGKNLAVARGYLSAIANDSYGYFGGGFYLPFVIYNGIDKLDFSNEVTSSIPTTMPFAGRYATASVSSPKDDRGYFVGGYTNSFPNVANYVERFNFSTETFGPTGTVHSASYMFGNISNDSFGYVAGGWDSPGPTLAFSSIYRIDFSNDSPSRISANLQKEILGGASSSNELFGYFIAGDAQPSASINAVAYSDITRLDFSNETTLSRQGYFQSTFGISATKGIDGAYISGDYLTNTVFKYDYTTESAKSLSFFTASQPSAFPSNWGTSVTSISKSFYPKQNKNRGYIVGGRIFSIGISSAVNRIDFSTETSTTTLRSIVERGYGFATSSNSHGYFTGGQIDPIALSTTYVTSIDRLDYSNETFLILPNRIPQRKESSTLESSSYGYFCGGSTPSFTSTVIRFDFSNEVLVSPGKNMSSVKRGAASVSNHVYGYVLSGQFTTNTERLDFSTESFTRLPQLLTERFFGTDNGVSSNLYGYFGGSYTTDSLIFRLDFSNETTTNPGNNLPEGRFYINTLSSSQYGYFAGGFLSGATPDQRSILERLDFSTESISVSTTPIGHAVSVAQSSANSN